MWIFSLFYSVHITLLINYKYLFHYPYTQTAMSGQRQLGFAENFGLSGAAAIISKTAAAPIERVKLLVQNQDEMIKAGRLTEPYKGVIDCTLRTYRTEGELISLIDFSRSGTILLLSLPVCLS